MYKAVDLALQGGGAHGAFTWGVLERLLEIDSLIIEGICGASAGAMNATIVTYGLQKGGRRGAIELLEEFWKKTAQQQKYSMLRPGFFDKMLGTGRMDFSPFYNAMDVYTQYFSPYQFNVLNYNPLQDLIEELIDFEELKKSTATKLFVCATNVRTGRAKIFNKEEISSKAVMASACIPHLFKAVEIDGEAYWDGGFMGNPPIFPLVDDTETEDILLIQINPILSDKIPKTAIEIRDRMNEISFNASLMHEMRKINFIQKNLHLGLKAHNKLRNLFIHKIAPSENMHKLGVSSKMNTDWKFLNKLRKQGREQADKWIKDNFDSLGERSTCDIPKEFL